MKITTLGKLILGLALCVTLNADVTIHVDKVALYAGDTVTFTLKVEGKESVFPSISAIDEFPILGTSNASSLQIINGDTTRTTSRSYSFAPTHDVTIPSFTVTVAGKSYTTDPQKLTVLTPKASQTGEPFVLELKADKTSAYVGEPITLSMVFKQHVGAKADKVEVSELSLKDFWVKKDDVLHEGVEGVYATKRYDYVLFPKKAGDIEIPALFSRVGTIPKDNTNNAMRMDNFFNHPLLMQTQLKWQKIFSNALHISVKPLPDNTYLYGDFAIEARVDKPSTKPNKPINLTIHISGHGNIEDILPFNPNIPDVALYADTPNVKASLKKGIYQGEFNEHIALVSDKDFTIPPFELSYFDAKTHTVVTQKTQAIPIHIIGAVASSAPILEKKKSNTPVMETPSPTLEEKAISLKPYVNIIGGVLGIFLLIVLGMWLRKKRKMRPISQAQALVLAIDKAKSDKALFDLLLPYAKKDPFITEFLRKLEANLYGGAKHVLDKKELKRFVKEHTF